MGKNVALEQIVGNDGSAKAENSNLYEGIGKTLCPVCTKDQDDTSIPITIPSYLYQSKGLDKSQAKKGQNELYEGLKVIMGHAACYEKLGLFYKIPKLSLTCNDCFFMHEGNCIKFRHKDASPDNAVCNHYNPNIDDRDPDYKKSVDGWPKKEKKIKENNILGYGKLIDILQGMNLIRYRRADNRSHKIVLTKDELKNIEKQKLLEIENSQA